MNKEILEIKIAGLLGVSDEEKNLAFKIFKEKLSTTLKIGEALRINDLGVFQLKEQLDHRSVSKSDEKSKNLTLVFSPQSDDPPSSSLFLNLEIENSKVEETEFNENVFQLGIGKQLVIDSDLNMENGENIISNTEKIEKEVSQLFEKSEKLKDFDLWEDYLDRKETTDILEDSVQEDLPIDSILTENKDDLSDVNIDKIGDEFIPETTGEIFDDMEENDAIIEDNDFKELGEGKIVEEIDFPDSIDESLESVIENDDNKLDEIDLELAGEEEQIKDAEKINETDFKEEINKSVIEKIDEELSESEELDKSLSDSQIYEDELNNLENDDNFSKTEDIVENENIDSSSDESIKNEDQLLEGELSDDNVELEETVATENEPVANKKSRSLLWLFILAFLIIGSIGIYYLFFNSTPDYSLAENEIVTSEAPESIVNENETDESNKINNQDKVEQDDQEAIIEQPVTKVENADELETKIESPKSVENEKEVSKNIYFDGFVYNVQISSWKQEVIAQKEVNKLVKSGFPAYKIKVYIPKFDGYWHRVRIGPFTSLQESQQILKKVNK